MSRSDSKIDLDRYMPSAETRREVWDEQAAQERERKALANPALDAAVEEYRSESETIPNLVPAAAPQAPAAPSPWSAGSADGDAIDRALLPSASAPVAPPVTTPIDTDESQSPAKSGLNMKGWSNTKKGLAAIACSFIPAMLVFLLFVKPTQQGGPGVPTSSSAPEPPTATAAASPAPTVSTAAPAPAMSADPSVPAGADAGVAPTSTTPSRGTSSTPSAPPSSPSLQHPGASVGNQAHTPPAVVVSATPPPEVTAVPTSAAPAVQSARQPPTPEPPPDAFLHKRPQ